ncbi:MAG: hydrogenase maturation nickel metallochaperone HypA [Methylocystis sp.]|uniref:hydrogenase maturation nickel metallochaperone HypA/HybF n=1 Tax=Methylocystis sp. TaxID=1911079 RepID=UPI003D0B63E7
MHELSIVCSIVELASEAAEGRSVRRVTIEIGKLSGVEPEAVAFCFPEVARGTSLENATLDIREVDAEARCDVCGTEFPTPDILSACPCGSRQFQRLRGEELNIKSIEVEEAA